MESTDTGVVAQLLGSQRINFESHEELASLIKRVDDAITDIQAKIFNLVTSHAEEFRHSFATAGEIETNVAALTSEVATFEKFIEEGSHRLLGQLLNQHQQLQETITTSEKMVQVISLLEQIHHSVSAIEKALSTDKLLDATSSMHRATLSVDRFQSLLSSNSSEPRLFSALKDTLSSQRRALIATLDNMLRSCISIKSSQLTINTEAKGLSGSTLPLADILYCLNSLHSLDDRVSAFASALYTELLRPLIANRNISLDISAVTHSGVCTATLKCVTTATPSDQYAAPFSNLLRVFAFVGQYAFQRNPNTNETALGISLMEAFARHLWPSPLCGDIIREYLEPQLPQDVEQLTAFENHISALIVEFERGLCNLGFFGERADTVVDSPLVEFVSNVRRHFAEKQRRRLLVRARQLIVKDSHNSVAVGGEIGHSVLATKFPRCRISETAKMIGELAAEAYAIVDTDAARDILLLYAAAFPAAHSAKLDNVPQLAVLFHNDCMYLAHYALMLSAAPLPIQSTSPSVGGADPSGLVAAAVSLRRLGEVHIWKVIHKQRSLVVESLHAAGGLADTHRDERQKAVESAFRQVAHHMVHLGNVWGDGVLPSEMRRVALGAVLDAAMAEAIQRLEDLKDITEEETRKLHAIFSLWKGCEALFAEEPDERRDGAHAYAVSYYVPHWDKFFKLAFILEASMAAIVERYQRGELKEFSVAEVRRLIVALFSDSPLRKQKLELIR